MNNQENLIFTQMLPQVCSPPQSLRGFHALKVQGRDQFLPLASSCCWWILLVGEFNKWLSLVFQEAVSATIMINKWQFLWGSSYHHHHATLYDTNLANWGQGCSWRNR
jgi:hypothetical protein